VSGQYTRPRRLQQCSSDIAGRRRSIALSL